MKLISLFSGIGGFELAAQWAGIETIVSCEIDEWCRKVLKYRFPNTVIHDDVCTLSFSNTKFEEKIIMTGGFPCQDLSICNTNNRQKINGERSGLWKEYARLVGEVRPEYIIFENSPMLLIGGGFERVLADLSRLGYVCEWRCFYATQYGFPHGRKRVYGVAYPYEKRWWEGSAKHEAKILQNINPKRTARQIDTPASFQRYGQKSNFDGVCTDDGIFSGLDYNSIGAYGNSIIVDIAFDIFKSILKAENEPK